MRRLFLFFLLNILITPMLLAQVVLSDEQQLQIDTIQILENVHEEQDPRLTKMLGWHIENNKRKNGIDGFRVEIFSNRDMKKIQQTKIEFISKFPELPVHIIFKAPIFKIRVGDFRTKNEALKLQKKIQKNYPGSFIVPDIIEFPLLKQKNYE